MSSQNLLSMAGTKACLHSSGDKLYEEVKALTTGSEAPMRRDGEGASEPQRSPATPIPPHVGAEGITRRESDSAGLAAPYVSSQAHLLKPSDYNPMPTAVPPPISANSGTLGVRHVLFIIGLPERGKPFIARRLKNYLSFFHWADVQLFDISAYAARSGEEPGSDANARLLLDELKAFMEKEHSEHARNMHVKRETSVAGDREESEKGGHRGRTTSIGPLGEVVDKEKEDDGMLVDEQDRRRKNVDSGRVAIIFATDSYRSFKEKWSGTSKERRRPPVESRPPALLDNGAPCARLVAPRAQAAPTHPGAPPEQLGGSRWPPQPASGRTKVEV